jgi:hypothetical protein
LPMWMRSPFISIDSEEMIARPHPGDFSGLRECEGGLGIVNNA